MKGSASKLRDLVAAFSLANLSLIGVWNALLNFTPAQTFFFGQAPSQALYTAALANVLLIGLTFFVLIRLVRIGHDRYGVPLSAPILLLLALPAIKALVRLVATSIPAMMGSGLR